MQCRLNVFILRRLKPILQSIQDMLNLVCTLGAAGAPLLVKAFEAGGDEARHAVAVLFDSECPGADQQPLSDAGDMLMWTREFSDPRTAWT